MTRTCPPPCTPSSDGAPSSPSSPVGPELHARGRCRRPGPWRSFEEHLELVEEDLATLVDAGLAPAAAADLAARMRPRCITRPHCFDGRWIHRLEAVEGPLKTERRLHGRVEPW